MHGYVMRRSRRSQLGALLGGAVFALWTQASALPQEGPAAAVELVDPKVFRVCSDPRNLPFSNEKGEGFENKLAELLAAKLGKSLAYTWYPNSTGFVRNTLGSFRCDAIMGFPQGDDIAQVTNPYYTASYALVYKPGTGLDGVAALSDARLKDKRIGIVAGTPPSNLMAANGLMIRAKPYPLVIDTRVDSSAQAMIKDLQDGAIDAGVLWGPMAGYYGMRAEPRTLRGAARRPAHEFPDRHGGAAVGPGVQAAVELAHPGEPGGNRRAARKLRRAAARRAEPAARLRCGEIVCYRAP